MKDPRPLIAHVVNSLRMGGLENGLINLINCLPEESYRHCVICLTDYDDFANRIEKKDVPLFAVHKKTGKDPVWYWKIYRILKSVNPAIVHTRNVATLESQVISFLLGVPGRVHGEHGWDLYDLHGVNSKYKLMRRIISPFVSCFVPLSEELENYLIQSVKVPRAKVVRICNGVDSGRFRPKIGAGSHTTDSDKEKRLTVGYLGRMEGVKDPMNLVEAFIQIAQSRVDLVNRVRLAMVGGGALHGECVARLKAVGLGENSWLPGQRNDTPELLRHFDIFVLPSRAEGISNTILEAMATGLPVVATRVGGNRELVEEGRNGFLVAPSDSLALARAITAYIDNESMRRTHGAMSRRLVEESYSIERMARKYQQVYDSSLSG